MRLKNYRRYCLLMTVVLLALLVSGCEHKTINEIKADPSRYANKEVAVSGTVTRSYSVAGAGLYEIDDGTGKLSVYSVRGVPREGARIVVKGTIVDALNLGSLVPLPEPIRSGLVMKEDSHKAR